MWDKATPSRPTGTGGVAHRASRADGPDWRIREGGLSEDTVARGVGGGPCPPGRDTTGWDDGGGTCRIGGWLWR
ncbi:hypothetical protein NDU88_010982 [Pleurodeles waltl]|uniref:Uncharacterized protein n=1 Tax=Pleurodeles waltl TaxID=8319 RepID=A0AAV7S163_PLEWA|nr:hypothetical protein NDU88_010982 [Pleurodeles waltl]